MAKSFKEIGKKAEQLIEQGKEADQKVQSCQARVASSNSRVAAARRQLAAASETDEEGNPVGDVEQARAQLSMAENQLTASQRALSSACGDADRVRQQKNAHVQEIEKHNQVERSNLEKLRKLRADAFGADSVALTEGMAQRLNEAEDARVALLRSMGIDAIPNHVAVGGESGTDSGWRGGGFATLDTAGQAQSYQGGGSEEMSSGGGIATPVGGGLASPLTIGDLPSEDSGMLSSTVAGQTDAQSDLFSTAMPLGATSNGFPRSETLQEAYDALVNRIVESSALSTEQKISELNMLRSQLRAVAQNYSNKAEAEAIKEHVKVLKLSPIERRQMGERYINDILEVYRVNLLDRGVVSISALDATISELRKHYSAELEKDLQGQPNGLYSDPNYDELVQKINSRRPPIANVSPGENMTFEQADSGHVNPNYGKDYSYSINCQSCVVAFEARERGYDVQVLPCTKGSALERLSHDPRMAWIDPKTGKHPDYIYDNNRRTPEDYLDFVNEVVKPGNRYTIQFAWKGRGHSGHIVNIDRTPNGLLRIKDNQRGPGEKSEWIGDFAVLDYLSRVKYEDTSLFGGTTPCVPQLLRVDNMDFDFSVVNHIMKGADNGTTGN
ncbi:MAG: toxin glutamine deamidase domain-containing protein [bacterium]|nr:toxin glutamine deamidase domain-containing protein [bacterium]